MKLSGEVSNEFERSERPFVAVVVETQQRIRIYEGDLVIQTIETADRIKGLSSSDGILLANSGQLGFVQHIDVQAIAQHPSHDYLTSSVLKVLRLLLAPTVYTKLYEDLVGLIDKLNKGPFECLATLLMSLLIAKGAEQMDESRYKMLRFDLETAVN